VAQTCRWFHVYFSSAIVWPFLRETSIKFLPRFCMDGEKRLAQSTSSRILSKPWQEFGDGSLPMTRQTQAKSQAQQNHRQIHATSHHPQSS
jgi:hypothetical protein